MKYMLENSKSNKDIFNGFNVKKFSVRKYKDSVIFNDGAHRISLIGDIFTRYPKGCFTVLSGDRTIEYCTINNPLSE